MVFPSCLCSTSMSLRHEGDCFMSSHLYLYSLSVGVTLANVLWHVYRWQWIPVIYIDLPSQLMLNYHVLFLTVLILYTLWCLILFVFVCLLLKHFNTYMLLHMHTHIQFNFNLFLIDLSIVKGKYKHRQSMICISKFE